MKKVLIAALMMGAALSSQAQNEWFQNVKFSGYGMVQYQASDKDEAETNGFNLRLVRMALEGRAHQDFYWKAQMQINGNAFDTKADGKKNNMTIRLVENPMHPITQGFMSYSQNVSKLAGFSDRCGGNASNGRDIGVQIQGDFLKDANGRNLLHYQIGAFNGEGINQKDKDNRKDIIGGVWIMPIKGMRIGAFGWTGTRGEIKMTLDEQPKNVNGEYNTVTLKSARKNRYAISGEYAANDWTFRTEYIHSQGFGTKESQSDKADGIYALCIAPIQKNKFHVKARYDLYREAKEWGQSKTLYEVGADYMFTKNLQINFEYARVNERAIADPDKHNYNMVDVELDFRF